MKAQGEALGQGVAKKSKPCKGGIDMRNVISIPPLQGLRLVSHLFPGLRPGLSYAAPIGAFGGEDRGGTPRSVKHSEARMWLTFSRVRPNSMFKSSMFVWLRMDHGSEEEDDAFIANQEHAVPDSRSRLPGARPGAGGRGAPGQVPHE